MKNFLMKKYKTILIILACLFGIYWVMYVWTPTDTMSKEDKAKIDSLTNLVNEINKHQNVIENQIGEINHEVDLIDNNISKIKSNKQKTEKKYHEAISNVDKYTEPELDSFFSNRYK